MSISGISSSTNSWQSLFTSSTSAASRAHAPRGEKGVSLQADLATLSTHLTSGDLTSAKTDAATIVSRMQAGPGGSADFNDAMSTLSKALDSGDVEAAKAALEKVGSAAEAMKPQGPPPPPPGGGAEGTDETSSSSDAISKALDALKEALEKDDVNSARSMFDSLQDLLSSAGSSRQSGGSSDALTSYALTSYRSMSLD